METINKYMLYPVWYKHLGLRRLSDFIHVKALNVSTILFPRYSVFHYYNPDNPVYPSKQVPIFSNIHTGIVCNILEFSESVVFRKRGTINEVSFANKIKKESIDFITVPKVKLETMVRNKKEFIKNTRIIFNYNYIHEHYRIPDNPRIIQLLYEATFNTILDTFLNISKLLERKNKEQHHFFIYKLPNILIPLPVIRRVLKSDKISQEYIKIFYNDLRLFLLDLHRIFSLETLKLSVLKKLVNEEDLKRFHIVFQIDDKVAIVNYYKLLSFSKDFDKIANNESIPPEKAMKLFHIFLKLLYDLPAFRIEDIESGKYRTVINEKLNLTSNRGLLTSDASKDVIAKLSTLEKQLETEMDIEDTEDISVDELIEQDETVEETVSANNTKVPIKSISEIMRTNNAIYTDVKNVLEYAHLNNIIDNKKYKRFMSQLETIANLPSPYDKNKKLIDMLYITKEEIAITDKDKKLPDIPYIPDPAMKEDTITAFDQKYIDNTLKKDIISAVFSIQRAGLVLQEYNIERVQDVLGDYEEHRLKFKDINGGTHSIWFKIPVVNKDGIFMMSGNEYRLRKSRLDLPIKKINVNRVALSSAYGKLFIDKAPYTKIDRGYKLRKVLLKMQEARKIKNLVLGNEIPADIKLPEDYYVFMRYVKSFVFNGIEFTFDYINRRELLSKTAYELEKIEKDNYVLVGIKGGKIPILMDATGILYEYVDGRYKKLGHILEVLGIKDEDLVYEYALVKIHKNYVPVFYILAYYLTLDGLLKLLNIDYTKTDKKVIKNLDSKDIVIRTQFDTYIIHPKNAKEQMIFGGYGYWEKFAKKVPMETFNNRLMFEGFFKDVGLSIADITKIKILENLFLDPVTINILEQMNEPTTLYGLIIRACELLTTDYYESQTSMKGFMIRGYDKIPQMIYNKLVEAIEQKMSEEFFGRSRLTFDPYSVWRIINEDSTSILVDDLNPIIFLKQKEDTTYTGFLGRKKESMSKATREYHPDNIGVISEGTKDSGDVAVTAYLSANPVFKNVRGIIDNKKKLSMVNILSTSANLAPFSIYDDPKRVNFINIQNTHIIPMNEMIVYPVRTGYELIIPYRAGKRFADYAKDDGVVEEVSKHRVKVKYNNGKTEVFTFRDWVSKEESHTSYKHTLVSNVVKGQKVKQGDIIYYDSKFFEPDMFDKTKVVYRPYQMVRVAMIESNDTYEDSAAMSKRLIHKAGIKYVKSRSIVLNSTEGIKEVKQVGDKVTPTDALLFITVDDFNINNKKIDFDKVKDILEGFVATTPRAKVKGEIIKIRMYYNCEYDELSDSLKKLADMLKEKSKKMNEPLVAKVDSSYSIEGIPLEVGKVEIKFYIETSSTLSTGDKGIFGNQMKFTIGEIYDYPIKTEDGRDVDALFSNRSLMKRVVNSPYLMGTTATLLRLVTENVIKMYFKDE